VRIREAGKVCDNLWYLGKEVSGVYLLEGLYESMIVSGGMSFIVPDLLRQIKAFGIDETRIRKLLILHAHFDHVGIVPYFKRLNPELEIYASARAWQILKMPKAITTINAYSDLNNEELGFKDIMSAYDTKWRDDVSGITVTESDTIDLGNMEVHILETPGHSSCSISAYVPDIKALFPSDGGGIPYKNETIPSGNSNYTQFQESLEKLKDLDVDYLCADHFGYIKGDEAGTFISETIEAAKKFRTLMERVYGRIGNVEGAVQRLVAVATAERPDYFLSQEIMTGVYRQMVKHIASFMESGADQGVKS
jgi:glyoxylase-like metal-dependent hydrolase (beta-lactamase superfamily II)